MAELRRSIPNLITIARLALALAFFAVLTAGPVQANFSSRGAIAIGLFIVAALSDVLDGYLARRWQATTQFGRIMDPFVDKVLVLGAFIILTGEGYSPASGVQSWMVVTIVAREFLVTTIRAVLESQGVAFPADWSGKLKMFAQSVTAPLCLFCATQGELSDGWFMARDTLVATTIGITFLSAAPYVLRAIRLGRMHAP